MLFKQFRKLNPNTNQQLKTTVHEKKIKKQSCILFMMPFYNYNSFCEL